MAEQRPYVTTGDADYWTLRTGDSDSESAGGSAPAGSWEFDVTSVITSAPTASLPFGIIELTIRSLWLAGLQVRSVRLHLLCHLAFRSSML